MPEKLTNCLLCGSEELRKDVFATEHLNLIGPHEVCMCCRCSFRFLNPRPTIGEYSEMYATGEGRLGETYPMLNEFYAQVDTLRIEEYRRKLDILKRVGARGRLLEIGSCTGVFLNEARKRGFDVVGIEPSEENRRLARERHGLSLLGGFVEDQRFLHEHFDVVFSSHVFEHLMDPLGVAKKICEWLRPGGFHMIEVPNQFENFTTMRRRWKGRIHPRQRSFTSVHHPVFFSPKTLRLLVQLSRCPPVHVRNVYYSYPNLLLHPRQMLGRLIRWAIKGSSWIEVLAQKRFAKVSYDG